MENLFGHCFYLVKTMTKLLVKASTLKVVSAMLGDVTSVEIPNKQIQCIQ